KPVEVADFSIDDSVMVVDGPFATLHATITEINGESQRVKALVEILGRETPVELSCSQLQRVGPSHRAAQAAPPTPRRQSVGGSPPRALDKTTTSQPEGTRNASQEEGRSSGEGPAERWLRHPGSAGRYRSRSPRRQHHGLLQGLQRADRVDAWQRDPRRD